MSSASSCGRSTQQQRDWLVRAARLYSPPPEYGTTRMHSGGGTAFEWSRWSKAAKGHRDPMSVSTPNPAISVRAAARMRVRDVTCPGYMAGIETRDGSHRPLMNTSASHTLQAVNCHGDERTCRLLHRVLRAAPSGGTSAGVHATLPTGSSTEPNALMRCGYPTARELPAALAWAGAGHPLFDTTAAVPAAVSASSRAAVALIVAYVGAERLVVACSGSHVSVHQYGRVVRAWRYAGWGHVALPLPLPLPCGGGNAKNESGDLVLLLGGDRDGYTSTAGALTSSGTVCPTVSGTTVWDTRNDVRYPLFTTATSASSTHANVLGSAGVVGARGGMTHASADDIIHACVLPAAAAGGDACRVVSVHRDGRVFAWTLTANTSGAYDHVHTTRLQNTVSHFVRPASATTATPVAVGADAKVAPAAADALPHYVAYAVTACVALGAHPVVDVAAASAHAAGAQLRVVALPDGRVCTFGPNSTACVFDATRPTAATGPVRIDALTGTCSTPAVAAPTCAASGSSIAVSVAAPAPQRKASLPRAPPRLSPRRITHVCVLPLVGGAYGLAVVHQTPVITQQPLSASSSGVPDARAPSPAPDTPLSAASDDAAAAVRDDTKASAAASASVSTVAAPHSAGVLQLYAPSTGGVGFVWADTLALSAQPLSALLATPDHASPSVDGGTRLLLWAAGLDTGRIVVWRVQMPNTIASTNSSSSATASMPRTPDVLTTLHAYPDKPMLLTALPESAAAVDGGSSSTRNAVRVVSCSTRSDTHMARAWTLLSPATALYSLHAVGGAGAVGGGMDADADADEADTRTRRLDRFAMTGPLRGVTSISVLP